MTFPTDQLPPDVVQILEQGNKIAAIKRLRELTGLGLAEAKALIDAQLRGRQGLPSFRATDQLPPGVIRSLEQGNAIQAIKQLRQHTRLGLAEAKALVDAHLRSRQGLPSFREAHAKHESDDAGRQHVFTPPDQGEAPRLQPLPPPDRSGLAPGEVKQSNAAAWVVAILVVVLVAYYYYFLDGSQ